MQDALGPARGFREGGFGAALPLAVVLPRSPDEVAATLRAARDAGVPVVARGAGTGLMGGARSIRPGLVIDLRFLDRVREIDVEAGYAWVEAGTVLEHVDRALKAHGLMLGHDPWTVGLATVGGAISTNGLGFLGGAYGSMGDQTIAVEAALADGTVIRTRPVAPRSAGFDLSRLFVGTEGVFGVVTAAALRAFPIPEERRLLGFRFQSFRDGFEAILELRRAGVPPAVLDYGDRFAPSPGAAGVEQVEPPTLYLGFDGAREVVEAAVRLAGRLSLDHGGVPLPDAAVRAFWEHRHDIAERFAASRRGRRRGWRPDGAFDYVHVSLPASHVLEYRARAMETAVHRGVHPLETGLWTAPGLFSMTLAAPASADAVDRMSAAVDACLELAVALGGSIEYCHGVGVRLAHLMRAQHGPGLDVLLALKRALDPKGILNPGKQALEPER
jgi:FAD/FMN-containing dehydrogenase